LEYRLQAGFGGGENPPEGGTPNGRLKGRKKAHEGLGLHFLFGIWIGLGREFTA